MNQAMSSFVLPQGVLVEDFFVNVPLDYDDKSRGDISVFYRILTANRPKARSWPILVYLEGGPGCEAPRPLHVASGWIGRALKEFRVLLVDQRGTGRSSRLTAHTLSQYSPEEQAEYLHHFRADNIVRDLEHIRQTIQPDTPWAVLGQSFGGFCVMSYLSLFPEGLSLALFTGGIPPLFESIENVYRATFRRVADKNRIYYHKFPGDVEKVKSIVRFLLSNRVVLPSGGILTPKRFQQIGLLFGGSGGMHRVHYLLESAFDEGEDHLSYAFLHDLDNMLCFDTNPVYSILHEAIYCEQNASNWAAARISQEEEFADMFSLVKPLEDDAIPVFFTGEMIFPSMFDGAYRQLSPLRDAAHILAMKDDWPKLYDKTTLTQCSVPCAAAIYYDDMYVERTFSEAAMALIPTLRCWITNEYHHSGLKDDGYRILDRLLAMAREETV